MASMLAMSESVFALLGGLLAGTVGVWMVRMSFRETLPNVLLVWWLEENDPARDPISRGLGRVVGGGFVLVGVMLLLLGSVSVLRHLSST